MVRKAALVLALLASPVMAKPPASPTVAERIAKAKTAMIDQSDRLFSSLYVDSNVRFEDLGVTTRQLRLFALWSTLSIGIGTCHDQGGDALTAGWIEASDQLSPIPSSVIKVGFDSLEKAKKRQGGLAQLTTTELRHLCAGEIGAARQLLAERFGVR